MKKQTKNSITVVIDNYRIDEIPRRVSITKSVIYYHFENKKEILRATLQRFLEEFAEEG